MNVNAVEPCNGTALNAMLRNLPPQLYTVRAPRPALSAAQPGDTHLRTMTTKAPHAPSIRLWQLQLQLCVRREGGMARGGQWMDDEREAWKTYGNSTPVFYIVRASYELRCRETRRSGTSGGGRRAAGGGRLVAVDSRGVVLGCGEEPCDRREEWRKPERGSLREEGPGGRTRRPRGRGCGRSGTGRVVAAAAITCVVGGAGGIAELPKPSRSGGGGGGGERRSEKASQRIANQWAVMDHILAYAWHWLYGLGSLFREKPAQNIDSAGLDGRPHLPTNTFEDVWSADIAPDLC
ncbi:hypothetical protein C8R44DRAFT_938195 [Mycena epipterygia]|nr:hypothetical protein C8R44DRAFT_938195 [Mycena epipterygia]